MRRLRNVLAAAALVATAVALVAPAIARAPDPAARMPALVLRASPASTTDLTEAGSQALPLAWQDNVIMLLVGTALIGLGGVLRRP